MLLLCGLQLVRRAALMGRHSSTWTWSRDVWWFIFLILLIMVGWKCLNSAGISLGGWCDWDWFILSVNQRISLDKALGISGLFFIEHRGAFSRLVSNWFVEDWVAICDWILWLSRNEHTVRVESWLLRCHFMDTCKIEFMNLVWI